MRDQLHLTTAMHDLDGFMSATASIDGFASKMKARVNSSTGKEATNQGAI